MKNNITPLTPIQSKYIAEKYKSIFELIEESPKIKNVAITGGYSSGKSTLIESLESEKYLSDIFVVSIPNFDRHIVRKSKPDDILKSDEIEIEEIERLFLKQLTAAASLPEKQTLFWFFNYEKKKNTKYVKVAIMGLLFACIFDIILLSNLVGGVLLSTTGVKVGQFWLILLSLLVIGVILNAIALKCVKHLYKNKSISVNHEKIKSIKIKQFHIEYNHKDVLIQNYESIEKLINNKKYKYIVFEDLDRFESKVIYEKFYELNYLLRLGGNQITFVYLIKDDLFDGISQKTKFFDLIIPIVPAISSYNSSLYLIEKIQGLDKKYQINDIEIINTLRNETNEFLTEIRATINIVNEYVIFYNTIFENDNPSDIEKAYVLVLIIYKNIFSKDFNKIYISKGKLKTLCDNYFSSYNESLLDIYGDETREEKFTKIFLYAKLITKDYLDYINVDKVSRLFKNDKTLWNAIKMDEEPLYYDKVNNPKQFIEYLGVQKYKRRAALNIYIVKEILEQEKNMIGKILISQVQTIDNTEKFISELYKILEKTAKNELVKIYNEFGIDIFEHIPEEVQRRDMIKNINDLSKLDKLDKHINDINVSELSNEKKDEILENVDQIVFIEQFENQIIEIIEEDKFVITLSNIEFLFKKEEIEISCFAEPKSRTGADQSINKYINTNIEKILEILYEEPRKNHENIEYVSDNIHNINVLKNVILGYDGEINNNDVPVSLYDFIIEKNKFLYGVWNFIRFFTSDIANKEMLLDKWIEDKVLLSDFGTFDEIDNITEANVIYIEIVNNLKLLELNFDYVPVKYFDLGFITNEEVIRQYIARIKFDVEELELLYGFENKEMIEEYISNNIEEFEDEDNYIALESRHIKEIVVKEITLNSLGNHDLLDVLSNNEKDISLLVPLIDKVNDVESMDIIMKNIATRYSNISSSMDTTTADCLILSGVLTYLNEDEVVEIMQYSSSYDGLKGDKIAIKLKVDEVGDKIISTLEGYGYEITHTSKQRKAFAYKNNA